MAGTFNLRGVGGIYLDPNPSLPEGGDLNSGILTFNGAAGALYLSYFNQSQIQVTQQIPGGETGILASNVLVGKSGMFGQQQLVGALYLPEGNLSSSSAYLQVSNQQGQVPVTFTVELIPVGGQVTYASFSISADPQTTNEGVVSVTNPLLLTEGWYGVYASCTGFGSPCLIGGLRLWVYPNP